MAIKKKGIMLISLICALSFLLSCSKAPIKIGLMVDLTGRASELGISGRNGAEIAVEEINQNGGINGRKVTLIIKDDKGIPEEAMKADKELIQENILLGIGHFASGTGEVGLKIFNEAGKLMISPTMSTESFTGIDDYFIRIIDSNKKQGEVLADAALSEKNNKKIAVVYEENNKLYTSEVCKYFKQRFEKSGGQIVMEDSFASSTTVNFDEIAEKISESGADGALIVSGGLDLAIITQKLKQMKPDIDIYAGMWAMTGDLIKNGGKSVEGVYLPGVYDKNDRVISMANFRSEYIEKYEEEPTFASVYSYETVNMVFAALKECKNKYDSATIKKKIIEIGTFKGLHDDFKVDRFGDTNRGYYLFQIKNAEFIRVK